MIDFGIGFFADCGDRDGKALRSRRIKQQKRKAAVAGNEAEFHGYLMTPRWLRSIKAASNG